MSEGASSGIDKNREELVIELSLEEKARTVWEEKIQFEAVFLPSSDIQKLRQVTYFVAAAICL